MPVIPALGRPRQEESEFKANLGYIISPVSKQKQKSQNKNPANQINKLSPIELYNSKTES
jgi:hypothetical protein